MSRGCHQFSHFAQKTEKSLYIVKNSSIIIVFESLALQKENTMKTASGRSAAALKAWATRRRQTSSLAQKRHLAALKAWETRRKQQG
jgi:hypothetical protein